MSTEFKHTEPISDYIKGYEEMFLSFPKHVQELLVKKYGYTHPSEFVSKNNDDSIGKPGFCNWNDGTNNYDEPTIKHFQD
jgi:hypothetical protein